MVDELVVTAHHEAAHAIATLVLGGRLVSISIDGGHGLTRRDPTVPLADWRKVVICLAGPIAEQRLRPEAIDLGAAADADMVIVIARRIVGDDLERAEHVVEELANFAAGLVVCYSAAIERVAQALLRDGRIDGDEACCRIAGIE